MRRKICLWLHVAFAPGVCYVLRETQKGGGIKSHHRCMHVCLTPAFFKMEWTVEEERKPSLSVSRLANICRYFALS